MIARRVAGTRDVGARRAAGEGAREMGRGGSGIDGVTGRLLGCGVAVGVCTAAGAALAPGAAVAGAALAPRLAAAGVAGVGAIAANLFAAHLPEWLASRLERSLSLLRNHDLAQAVGDALAMVLYVAADEEAKRKDRGRLRKLAKIVPQRWVDLVRSGEGVKLAAPLTEGELTTIFVAAASPPEGKKSAPAAGAAPVGHGVTVPGLDGAAWQRLLERLCLPDANALYGDVSLPQGPFERAARKLETTFVAALTERLKADFGRDGKAYAGLQLLLMGEIAAGSNEMLSAIEQLGVEAREREVRLEERLAALTRISEGAVARAEALLDRFDAGQWKRLSEVIKQVAGLDARIGDRIGTAEARIVGAVTDAVWEAAGQLGAKLDALGPQPDAAAALRSGPPPAATLREVDRPSRGREKEVAALLARLGAERVVTITGLGGIGKTQVALDVARQAKETGYDWASEGVFDLNLQEVTTADAIGGRLLSGLRLSPAAEWRNLALQMAGRRLYVLDDLFYALDQDNARTLELVATLAECAAPARFLLTSRVWARGLGVEVPLSRLQPPHDGALFDDVARSVDARLGEGDAPLRDALLGDLDGYPLAITLAASLLRDWSPATLRAQWQARRTAALRDPEAAPHRLTSVDVSLGLSYATLADQPAALTLFHLFADLPAGATEALLAAVLGDDAWPDAVLTLTRRSLVRREGARYTMLAPVREYAAARATEAPPPPREALDTFLRDLAQQWGNDDDLIARTGEAVAALRSELPNLHAALDRAKALQDHRFVAEVVDALKQFYPFAMPGVEVKQRLEDGAAAAVAIGAPGYQANCLLCLGQIHRVLSEYPEARERYEEALAIYRAIPYRLGVANCLLSLGEVHHGMSEYPEARERYEEALVIYRATSHQLNEATCLLSLGDMHLTLSEYKEAWGRYEEALAICRAIGHRLGVANCIKHLGIVHMARREYPEAQARYGEAQELYRAIGARRGEGDCIQYLGNLHRALSEYREARERYEEALSIWRAKGLRDNEANTLWDMAWLSLDEGDRAGAIDQMEEAAVIYEAIGVTVSAERARGQVAAWRAP